LNSQCGQEGQHLEVKDDACSHTFQSTLAQDLVESRSKGHEQGHAWDQGEYTVDREHKKKAQKARINKRERNRKNKTKTDLVQLDFV